jgi:Uma2 family endonuclease
MSTPKHAPHQPVGGAATLADLDELPIDVIGEIIGGVLYAMPRPRPAHQRTTTLIGGHLANPFDLGGGDGPGGWWILVDPLIALPGAPRVVPDLAGWRRERMPELPDGTITVVPDWVCEILSPSTAVHDLETKAPHYCKVGVLFLWIVDVDVRTVSAYKRQAGNWHPLGVYSTETDARIGPFEEVPLNVTSWWPPAQGSK